MKTPRLICHRAMLLFFLQGTFACGNDPSSAGFLVPKTVVEDLTLPSATINGAKLHLKTNNTGSPSSGNNIIFYMVGQGMTLDR